jgi:hypothetical protein
MEQNEQLSEEDADRKGLESHSVGILLNAPNILSRLVDTAVLLSLFTGILYIWGSTYFTAFIQALDLKTFQFAFNIPTEEVLLGGTNVISYSITGVPFAYWSVGLGLMVVIILVGIVQLILVPVLTRLAGYVTPLLSRLWQWTETRVPGFVAFGRFRKMLAGLAPKKPKVVAFERNLTRIMGSVELYIAHGVILFLMLMLLILGNNKSWELGKKSAELQLSNSPLVQITYGENEKIESTLCGRIGSDYILRSQESNGKYDIVKESTIKRIIIIKPAPQKNP